MGMVDSGETRVNTPVEFVVGTPSTVEWTVAPEPAHEHHEEPFDTLLEQIDNGEISDPEVLQTLAQHTVQKLRNVEAQFPDIFSDEGEVEYSKEYRQALLAAFPGLETKASTFTHEFHEFTRYAEEAANPNLGVYSYAGIFFCEFLLITRLKQLLPVRSANEEHDLKLPLMNDKIRKVIDNWTQLSETIMLKLAED